MRYGNHMKYLAVDFGLRRTGIAATDGEGRMAFPRRTLHRTTNDAFFASLLSVLEEERPEALVVGLPVKPDGEETLTTRQVRNFVKRLKRRTSLPIYWMPEFLSSFEAEDDLRRAGRRGSALRAVLDQQAAVRILESFLAQPEERRMPA